MASSVDDKPYAPTLFCDEVMGEVHCGLLHNHDGPHAYDEGNTYYANGYTIIQFVSTMWHKGKRPPKE